MEYTSDVRKLTVAMLREKCAELGMTCLQENGKKRPRKELENEIIQKLNLKPRFKTEDIGHILEMAVCITLNIKYIGEFKYSIDKATQLANKMGSQLREHISEPLTHTAYGKGKYDFTGETLYLSAKSNKKHHYVAPQSIGQLTQKRFCEVFGLSLDNDNYMLKQYIIVNIQDLLQKYISNTFDCTVLYYHEKEQSIQLINLNQSIPICWKNQTISFSKPSAEVWNESNSIYIDSNGISKSIGNIQFHKNRNCIKFRWNIRNLISLFPVSFIVRKIC